MLAVLLLSTLSPFCQSHSLVKRQDKIDVKLLSNDSYLKAGLEYLVSKELTSIRYNFDNIYLNEQTKPLYDYCNCNTAEELLVCLTDQPNSIIIGLLFLKNKSLHFPLYLKLFSTNISLEG
mgnify:CR=1 FL=1